MIKTALLVALAMLIANASTTARSANFDFVDAEGVRIITMTGEFTEGDAKVYDLIANGRGSVVLVLEGPGGLLGPALAIGAQVRSQGHATLVNEKSSCLSACALLWLAGAKRFMADDAVIGLHAAYRERNGVKSESGVANARVGAYLTMLGLSLRVVEFATTADPDSIARITPAKARELGIEIAERGSGIGNPPQGAPPRVTPPPMTTHQGQAAASGVKDETFDRAVRNFRTTYLQSGMAGINDAIGKCYARASALKTVDAAAYCVALDTLATATDMAMAPKGSNDAVIPYNRLEASLVRGRRAASQVDALESLPSWHRASIEALKRAGR